MNLALVAVMGPTASGKSTLAETIARHLDAVLVNADAFQCYRGMDVGTAKPPDRSFYRLLDIRDPNESLGVGEWVRLAHQTLLHLHASGRHAVVVGGTGLYIRALFEEYADMADEPDPAVRERLGAMPIDVLRERLLSEHPEIAGRTDLANPVRVRRAFERLDAPRQEPLKLPPFRRLKVGLLPDPNDLDDRIERRTAQMVQNGWTQEIERLREQGYRREDPGMRAIGYRQFWDQMERKISLDEAITATIVETRRYAKRQRTWLRSEPDLVGLSTAGGDAVRKTMERIESVLI